MMCHLILHAAIAMKHYNRGGNGDKKETLMTAQGIFGVAELAKQQS